MEPELTLHDLTGAMPAGLLVVDRGGRVSLANATADRLLGAATGSLAGLPAAEALSGANWEAALSGHTPPALAHSSFVAHLAPLPGGGAMALLCPLTGMPGRPLREDSRLADPFAALVGESQAMARLRQQAALAARTDATVLLAGESGTGKELVARAIHEASARRSGPFVAVNCAAVPENLLEAEFFGYADGAFTGARRGGKAGKFERAEGGTLFLDEIGDLALPLQAKLLRVLQEREVERVGSTRSIRVNVRIIAASNRNLEAMVAGGEFRADLFYRLGVLLLTLPALRERPEDLPGLVQHLLLRLQARHGIPAPAVTPEALDLLSGYDWPGNVRELENLLERALALYPGTRIGPAQLPPRFALSGRPASPWQRRKQEAEQHTLLDALQQVGGNKAAAARLLGLSRSQLYVKLSRFASK